MAYPPTQDELTEQTVAHWKKHLPDRYRRLKRTGKLQEEASWAAQTTLEACKEMISQGASPLEAWEMLRNDWCFLRAETKEVQQPVEQPPQEASEDMIT